MTVFSPDGSRVVTPFGPGLRVWDVRSGLPLTERLDFPGFRTRPSFSPDGRFISCSNPTGPEAVQRIWSVAPQASGRPTPKWLLTLATICAGQRLTDDNKFIAASDDFAKLAEIRRIINELPASDRVAEWARWILSDDPNRSIAPGFTITPAAVIESQSEMAEVTAETAQDRARIQRANALSREGKWAEAEALQREILENARVRAAAGGSTPTLPLFYLGVALMRQGKFDEAEPIMRECVSLSRPIGAGSWQFTTSCGVLGQILLGQGKLSEAEPLLLVAYNGFRDRRVNSATNVGPAATAGALVQLYTARNEPAKAAGWQKIVDALTEGTAGAVRQVITPPPPKQ